MKSMLRLVCGWCAVAFCILPSHAADTNLPPRLTVELRDGSRVVGTSVEKNLKFHSALLGDLKLAVKDIRSVEWVATNAVKLKTAGGDLLTVFLVDSDFAVKTSFGKVNLPANSIRHLSVSLIRHTGQMRAGLVASWLGEGDDNSVIVVPTSAALVSMEQTRQLTIEAWIKPNSIPQEFPVLLSKGGNQPGGAYGGYELMLNANGDNDLVFVSGGCCFLTHNANGRWINNHLGEWIHVAFTLDDQTKSARFYVNGQPTNDEFSEGTKSDLNFDLSNNLYIGAPDPASHPNRSRFDGKIRGVMLFNRALTAGEIHEDYEADKLN